MTHIQSSQFDKFKRVLREVFMLDHAELDFGIYRIMNQKRVEIDTYLNESLAKQMSEVLTANAGSRRTELQTNLDNAIKNAKELGIDPEQSPKVKELKAQMEEIGTMDDLENSVYNHLAIFFSRYYDGGDFISQRRYKKNVYAIPYEGEEVKLHWANADQYYIKTGEYFKNYSFRLSNGKRVEFTLKEVTTEQNNNKATDKMERRFALFEELPIEEIEDTLHINFTYELLPKATKQKKLMEDAFDRIKPLLIDNFKEYAEVFVPRPTDSDRNRTLLQKHLNDYVARNTFDYFIHKNLHGFLTRELDFYIKNEVLFIDDIDAQHELKFLNYLSMIKALKAIGGKIITFLASLENFQKKLWLKKKFVTETNYCITLDRVPESLYPQICENEAQRKEWVRLFAIDEIEATSGDMFGEGKSAYSEPLTGKFLKENPFLVLDTAFFSEEFKYRLIESIDNIDEQCDGLLINSENFQALELLQEKYKERIKAIYIDPPYNTGDDDFLYKDNYQESSWLSCINDRLKLCTSLYKEGGSIAVSIDIKELDKLIALLDSVLGSENRKANITVRRASITGAKVINPGLVNISENVVLYSNGNGKWIPQDAFREKDYDNRYGMMITNIDDDMSQWEFSTVLEEFSKFKGITKSKLKKELGETYSDELLQFVISKANSIVQLASLDLNSVGSEAVELYKKSVKDPSKIYHLHRDGVNDYYLIKGKVILFYKDRLKRIGDRLVPVEKVSDIWDDVLPNDIHNEGGVVLKKGKKPEKLIDRILESTTKEGDIVLDYFAGSATSGAVCLKSKRKFINIEVNEYFDSIPLTRIKNTLYGDKSGVTDIHNWKGGGIVKYIRLEQYEDTLNNLMITANGNLFNDRFKESYLLGYMLDAETKGSLFNTDWFVNPFEVKLNITRNNETKEQVIDLVETFNYLIGLYVETISYPKDGLCVVTGHIQKDKKVLVIWRDCNKINNDALNAFFKQSDYSVRNREFDRIYVNGDNTLENVKKNEDNWKVILTEQVFQEKMFEEV